jgi:hypothetical protein
MSAIGLATRGYLNGIPKKVVLAAPQAQAILTKALELPLPISLTESRGIFQPDIILRSAITVALADIRANPWLLDYVFASLPQDQLTWKEYGQQSIQTAKDWFLKTNIPVVVTPVLNESKWPAISITLLDSSEVTSETTLGDIHYEPTEGNFSKWPSLTDNFTPQHYNPGTGLVTLSSFLTGDIQIAKGMYIVDFVGRTHEILEVIDDKTFRINPGVVADFRNSTLKGHKPSFITHLESASYRETYRIGIHVSAEPTYLIWLHSLMVFCLLRYKEALLEARGFERSVLQSSDLNREESVSESELIFSRYVTITGYVRQYWPKAIATVIDGVGVNFKNSIEAAGIRVIGGGSVKDAGLDPEEQLWVGDMDSLTQRKK